MEMENQDATAGHGVVSEVTEMVMADEERKADQNTEKKTTKRERQTRIKIQGRDTGIAVNRAKKTIQNPDTDIIEVAHANTSTVVQRRATMATNAVATTPVLAHHCPQRSLAAQLPLSNVPVARYPHKQTPFNKRQTQMHQVSTLSDQTSTQPVYSQRQRIELQAQILC
jgi:hypothetical protein